MSSEDDESRVGVVVVLVVGSEDVCSASADLRGSDEKGRIVRRDDAWG